MEKLSKILLVALIICLLIIGGYVGYLGYVQHRINVYDAKCEEVLCNVGHGNVTSHHYSPFTNICHCFNGNEVERWHELIFKV